MLKNLLGVFSFISWICITCNRRVVHCMSKFCWWNRRRLIVNACKVRQKIAKNDYQLRHFSPFGTTRRRIILKFDLRVFFENLARNSWISGSILFQTRFVQNSKMHIVRLIFFLENHTVYEIMWKNIVKLDKPYMTMAHAYFVLDT
jgi:hypothetical protein